VAKQLPHCELLKSQPLTKAAASHQQNRADDDNVYLIGLPTEASALACTEHFGNCVASPVRWHYSQNKIVSKKGGQGKKS
jgi:hypothetical protein